MLIWFISEYLWLKSFKISPLSLEVKQLFQSNYSFLAFAFVDFQSSVAVIVWWKDLVGLHQKCRCKLNKLKHFSRQQELGFCLLCWRRAPFGLKQVKLFISGRTRPYWSGEHAFVLSLPEIIPVVFQNANGLARCVSSIQRFPIKKKNVNWNEALYLTLWTT